MKIIECPRDAMQGLHDFIPTETKINYINKLLKCGFDTIDFGSFVSPKAIPQMADTAKVVDALELDGSVSKLLAIIANERGANDACQFEQIQYLGFPFSVSETFQQRNTRASQEQAVERIKAIQELAVKHNKEMVVYLSMGFGNPYGDEWNTDIVLQWVEEFSKLGINILSLADTVGVAQPEDVSMLYKAIIPAYENIEFGAHFHSTPTGYKPIVEAALQAGCTRFDSSMKGIGGCPMAKDDLVGNIATENLIPVFAEHNVDLGTVNQELVAEALVEANKVFA